MVLAKTMSELRPILGLKWLPILSPTRSTRSTSINPAKIMKGTTSNLNSAQNRAARPIPSKQITINPKATNTSTANTPKTATRKVGSYLNKIRTATTIGLPTRIATNPKTTTIPEDRTKELNFKVKGSPPNTKATKGMETTMKPPILRDSINTIGKIKDSTNLKEEIPLATASEDTRRTRTNLPPAMSTNTPPPRTYRRK